MKTIHITRGAPLANGLRAVLQQTGRTDHVIALDDDLTTGPLRGIDDTPDPRIEFWQRVDGTAPGAADEALQAGFAELVQLEEGNDHVVIWHSEGAADQLALRRVCYRLRNMPQRLNEVRLGNAAGDGTAPETLGALVAERLPDAAPISVLRITRLALEWQEAKHANGETRRWRDNTFTSGSYAELDAQILDTVDAAEGAWQCATQIAGQLQPADTGFPVSPRVVQWRLRELGAAGSLRVRDDEQVRTLATVPLARPAPAPDSRSLAHFSFPG